MTSPLQSTEKLLRLTLAKAGSGEPPGWPVVPQLKSIRTSWRVKAGLP